MNKLKSNLDKRHKDFIEKFEKENEPTDKNELKLLENQLNELNKNELNKLNKLSKFELSKFDKENIKNKTIILDKIKNIKNKNKNNEEIIYYNNSIDYLQDYYDLDNSNNNIKLCDISDFFNNKINNINKSKVEILENYLRSIDNKQIKINKFKKYKPKKCPTINCQSELTLHNSDGYLICTSCGYCEEIIVDSDKPNYKEPVSDATNYSYKRINHFNELTNWYINIFILI